LDSSSLCSIRLLGSQAILGEAEEDEAEDGLRLLLGCQAAVGAELVGGGPEALLERIGGEVLLRGSDPLHGVAEGHPVSDEPD